MKLTACVVRSVLTFMVLWLSVGSAQAGVYFVHGDHLGTPQVVSQTTADVSKTVVWKAKFDPFGKATILVGGEPPQPQTFVNNWRFPGQYFDEESGLHYNYFRDYEPSTGRYLQSDPIGLDGGINTYAYALNSPLGFTDPYGLLTWGEALAHYISRRGGILPTPFADHDPGFGPTAFPDFEKEIAEAKAACKCGGGNGSRQYKGTLPYDTGGAPGRIVLWLSGSIVCDGQCNCRFQGAIGANDDPWDFDERPWGERDPGGFPYPKEGSTRAGETIPGVPFTTRFTGPRPVRY